MLHQFKKNQMITRSRRASNIDKIEMFMANAEMANQQAYQTEAFIQDCLKHLNQNGNIDVFRKNITSVCNNQLATLNKLIIVGTGLAEIDKGFENPFSFVAALDNIKKTAEKMEKIIADTIANEVDDFIDETAMLVESMGGHIAKNLKS